MPSSVNVSENYGETIGLIQEFFDCGTVPRGVDAVLKGINHLIVYWNGNKIMRVTPEYLHYNATPEYRFLKDSFHALAEREGLKPVAGGVDESGDAQYVKYWPWKNPVEIDDTELVSAAQPVVDDGMENAYREMLLNVNSDFIENIQRAHAQWATSTGTTIAWNEI